MSSFYVRRYLLKFYHLIKSPIFLLVTLSGNMVVFLMSALLFYAEKDVNPKISEFMDALWWGFATITTVGYGDITPISFWGRVIGILSMLLGTALFATYTALFAQAILSDEGHYLLQLEKRAKQATLTLEQLQQKIKAIESRFKE